MGAKSSNANTIKNWNALKRRRQRREGTENCQFKYEYKVNSEKNSAGRTIPVTRHGGGPTLGKVGE